MAHILVIEDDLEIRYLLRVALEFQGYQVSEAANGYEGLQRYQIDPADLVITDMQMPVMDGIELLAELRHAFPLAKVVAISAEKRLLDRAKNYNIQGAFEKPLRLPEVLQAVRKLVDTHAIPEARDNDAVCLTTFA